MTTHGLLLAAGAGSRMGMPKALVTGPDGRSWLAAGVTTLREGGCEAVTVVLGAQASDALALLGQHLTDSSGLSAVVAEDWASGQAASLRAGLAALTYSHAEAALVHLVDLPDVSAEVVRRVLAAAPARADALARASYDGRPGHPVLLGRDHWTAVAGSATGDSGARDYLARHETVLVECGDLASGADVDEPTGDQRPAP